jgi:HD-GYP domain-containing protein (c-di-GMP phosphodiesterase class II)
MLLAERLVGEARTRRARRMPPRERLILGIFALVFLASATAIALLVPNERTVDPIVVIALTVGYALANRVRFESAAGFGTAEQLALVLLIALGPLPYVPLLIAVARSSALLDGSWHRDRLADRLAELWYCIPPVLVVAAFAPGDPTLDDSWVYALAFASQLAADFLWSLFRALRFDGVPLRELTASWFGSARVDAILAPVGFIVALPAVTNPLVLLTVAPLVWLLRSFAKDREERYSKALELQRAYRGTVMLLSDVVEFEDDYTAQHSRSVVELVNAVADELDIALDDRQELEFAAMLHDVGKIAIPKEILNKPAALTDTEFEVMKTHTIEGQFMLDRVGGLLGRVGEIVRSCHERWDGRGYPDGLSGKEIPLASRIVFACDAYHAMTSDRVYRSALPQAHALHELSVNAGSQFDPRVVTALTRVVQERSPASSPADEVRAVLASASEQSGMPVRAVS